MLLGVSMYQTLLYMLLPCVCLACCGGASLTRRRRLGLWPMLASLALCILAMRALEIVLLDSAPSLSVHGLPVHHLRHVEEEEVGGEEVHTGRDVAAQLTSPSPHASHHLIDAISSRSAAELAALLLTEPAPAALPAALGGLGGRPRNISVVMPCYGHNAYIEEALASVVHQQYPPAEIKIVDDGSEERRSPPPP